MTIEGMMAAVLAVSTLAGLATEAVKKLLAECGRECPANLLAGGVSLVMALAAGVLNAVQTGTVDVVSLVVLMFLSWLCAMVGYDKVKQTITQIIGG